MTSFVFVSCDNDNCNLRGVARQVFTDGNGKSLHEDALTCSGCGEPLTEATEEEIGL